MSIAASVENGTTKVPPDIHLPDGTKVAAGERGALGWMAEFAGCIAGLPEDFLPGTTHYTLGTPKRAGR